MNGSPARLEDCLRQVAIAELNCDEGTFLQATSLESFFSHSHESEALKMSRSVAACNMVQERMIIQSCRESGGGGGKVE